MSDNELIFTGTVNWAKVYPGMENKYGKLSVDFFPTDADRKTIQALKSRNTLKEADDASKGSTGFFYTFVRSKDKGPIVVVDEGGNPFDQKIGNGSTVELTLEVYSWDNEHGKGTATRVVRVRVLKLVKYEKPADPNAWKPTEKAQLPA